MTTIPDNFKDLLTSNKVFAHLGTVMADGTPQVTPVWFDYDGGVLRVNSAKGRVKDRNMRANPNVALSLLDPDNGYRYIQLRGKVTGITEQGADAHIDALAQKYLGKDYPFRQEGEVRVTYVIAIEHVNTMG